MDALTYFLFHSFLYNLLLGLAFALLGVLAGWGIWGRYQRRSEESELKLQFAQTQLTRLKAEVEPLRAATAAAEAKLAAAQKARSEAEARAESLGGRVSRLDLESQSNARLVNEARDAAAAANAQVATLRRELERTPTIALERPGALAATAAAEVLADKLAAAEAHAEALSRVHVALQRDLDRARDLPR